MTRFVIDAPTLVRLVAGDVVVSPEHQLVAPNSIRSRALGLLLTAVRNGELTEREALRQHERMTELKMRLLGDRGSRGLAWKIAREHDWDNIDDAEYLAIARLQADALIAAGAGLRAKADGIVPIAELAALAGGPRE